MIDRVEWLVMGKWRHEADGTRNRPVHEIATQRSIAIFARPGKKGRDLKSPGDSSKEIAARLNMAPRTVEGHMAAVRLKLRARDRVQIFTRVVIRKFLRLEAPQSARLQHW